eukprot:TRINITY_DN25882_c0_g1_i1.p1 TRINITY_DN25882_c0_g1~~TRINITY_DN25882_c0_g1_i1.p1  ORF type:complete len:120 (+),score=40.56 TRINITY_DN25882_c0_g1_i1:1-360(+)
MEEDDHTYEDEQEGIEGAEEEPIKSNPHSGVLKFRNYVPRDPQLKELRLAELEPPEMIDEVTKDIEELESIEDSEIVSLAPKKANWDLERDLESKMKVLDRRTKRSIQNLILKEATKKS